MGQYTSLSEMVEIIEKWLVAIPDIKVRLLRTIEEEDIVIAHWRAEGTHQKELHGVAPQGKPLSYQGVSMYRFVEGKVVEYWAYLDSWTLDAQMKGEGA